MTLEDQIKAALRAKDVPTRVKNLIKQLRDDLTEARRQLLSELDMDE